jgi:hypothetical protein
MGSCLITSSCSSQRILVLIDWQAATMAMDLGLGANPKSSRRRRAADIEADAATTDQLDENDLEKRRTFLVCYMITTRYVK